VGLPMRVEQKAGQEFEYEPHSQLLQASTI